MLKHTNPLRRRFHNFSSPKSMMDGSTSAGGGGGGTNWDSFFSGRSALWLGGVATLTTFLFEMSRDNAGVFIEKIRDCVFVKLEVRSHQPEHSMLLEWIAGHPKAQKAHSLALVSSHPTASSSPALRHDDEDDTNNDWSSNHRDNGGKPQQLFTVNYGVHMLTYKDHWLWIDRHIDTSRKDNFNIEPYEVLTLTMGAMFRKDLLELVTNAKEEHKRRMEHKTTVWLPSDHSWRRLTSRQKRPLDSVVLAPGLMDDLVADARKFFSHREEYVAKGVPWRRGYFLHGPPGTGKSSFIYSLAGMFNLDVYLVNIADPRADDSTLLWLLNSVPERSLVVLEDIDVGTLMRSSQIDNTGGQQQQQGKITFSGLLNAIDGIAASEGRLLVMTSNHPETLPPALLRAGRVDRRVEFANLTQEQAQEMYLRFKGCTPALRSQCSKDITKEGERISRMIPEKTVSPAQFQNFLLEEVGKGETTSGHPIESWLARWREEGMGYTKIAQHSDNKSNKNNARRRSK